MMKTITVKDLGDVITGNTPPRSKPELYGDYTPFIKATDISETSKYTYEPEECYSEEGHKKYRNSLIPKGATCVVTIGSVGKKMTMAHCDCFINQAMNAIIPNENYDKEYVYYLLKHNVHKLKMLNSGTASGRENVSKSAFSNMELLVVQDIAVQKKIGSILSDFDRLIENNQNQINLLEEAAQRLYKEWFVDLRFPGYEGTEIVDGVPEGWKKHHIDDVFHIKYGKTLPTSKITKEGKYPVYGANGVIGFYLEKNVDDYVVLITSRGNGSGDVLRTHDKESFVTNNSFIVKPYDHSIRLPFIHQLMKNTDFKNICTGSAQPQLTNNSISTLLVLLPSCELISQFCDIESSWYEKIEMLLTQNRLLSQARDRLLPKLMNGEIEV